jgi:hypothetical protein
MTELYVMDWAWKRIFYRVNREQRSISAPVVTKHSESSGFHYRFHWGPSWTVFEFSDRRWLLINRRCIWIGDPGLVISRRAKSLLARYEAKWDSFEAHSYNFEFFDADRLSPLVDEIDRVSENLFYWLRDFAIPRERGLHPPTQIPCDDGRPGE